jgi:hypothetical protein
MFVVLLSIRATPVNDIFLNNKKKVVLSINSILYEKNIFNGNTFFLLKK